MKTQDLIQSLTELTQSNTKEVQAFKELPIEKLNLKQDAKSWSVLECIEHLNRYGDFYIPEIKNRLEKSTHKKSETFKSGILGNYFAKSMLPKEKLNKMKTFKSMNPLNSSLDKGVLDKFIAQQEQFLTLLEKSKNTNLTKVKTSISISKWIKLRLGDTFRVVIYHNLRHVEQAKKIIKYQ
ncbi:MAG: DinB family protein [Fulvivirga sp.]